MSKLKTIKTKLESLGYYVTVGSFSDESCKYLSVFKNKNKKHSQFELIFNFKETKMTQIVIGKKENNCVWLALPLK